MGITNYIGGGTDKMVLTVEPHVAPGGHFWSMRLRQIIGGKRWSLAIITQYKQQKKD